MQGSVGISIELVPLLRSARGCLALSCSSRQAPHVIEALWPFLVGELEDKVVEPRQFDEVFSMKVRKECLCVTLSDS
jgi:hypothetical protein